MTWNFKNERTFSNSNNVCIFVKLFLQKEKKLSFRRCQKSGLHYHPRLRKYMNFSLSKNKICMFYLSGQFLCYYFLIMVSLTYNLIDFNSKKDQTRNPKFDLKIEKNFANRSRNQSWIIETALLEVSSSYQLLLNLRRNEIFEKIM